ncbi:glycosyltransferase family 2 protein [Romboutsia hominis]|uniref:Glycosyltransferase family 2 protein n=2 Tax=Romboutsia faecis TaxID=2764597 RepID=A0ABR7JSP8_9FIRM|nr:glycosyltransferase family 2 protein [Romboutsia faecis]
MIVKNEENVIDRCLNSVKNVVDEIIIVDTGSTDNTVAKAENLGAIVYKFKWIDDFAEARNYSFSKATKDYILWLDADDILEDDDVKKLEELKVNLDQSVDSVMMNYVLQVDKYGNSIYSLKRNRLVKRSRNFRWIGYVHEYLEVYGNIIQSDINIVHKKDKEYTSRNLEIYEKKISSGIELSIRDILYYGNELYDNGRYDDAIEQYVKFIKTKQGWVEDVKTACYKLADCYMYKNDKENELKYILKSFEYDVPRADFCCRLAYKFLEENKLEVAIYWYRLALNSAPKDASASLINHEVYTYLPWIQLCVCYSRMGNMEEAYICNEMAAKYKEDDEYVKNNREFLKDKVNLSLGE